MLSPRPAQAASPRRSLRACPLPGLNEGDLQERFKASTVAVSPAEANETHAWAGIQFTGSLGRRRRSCCPHLLSGSSVKRDAGKIGCKACSAEGSLVRPSAANPRTLPRPQILKRCSRGVTAACFPLHPGIFYRYRRTLSH